MDISSASTQDYVRINSHIHMIYNDKEDCEDKYQDRSPEKREAIMRKNGCLGTVDYTVAIVGDIIFNRCLCNFKFKGINQLLNLLRHYEKGIMPFSGSILEQPNKIIEQLDIALAAKERELNNIRERHAKK